MFMPIVGTRLGNGVPTIRNRFYGKALYQGKKQGDLILNLPFYL